MFDNTYNPTIYSASKIWHNIKWRNLRDNHGFNIIARWINVECGTYENPTGAKQLSPPEKRQLWIECKDDVKAGDFTVIYGEPRDEQRGGTVEFGMALGMDKPIYVLGNCPFFGGNSHSDAAYMHHPLVHRVHCDPMPDGSFDYLNGYKLARNHFLSYYHTAENVFRKTGFLNARTSGSFGRLYQETVTS